MALVDGADVGDPMFEGTGDEDITGVSGGVGEQDVSELSRRGVARMGREFAP